jgi:predicted transposase YdaD
MAPTNNPLKRLVTEHPAAFATWLLGVPVVAAEVGLLELPADPRPVAPDQVLIVTLEDGRHLALHIEFQGPGSATPVPLRMHTYMKRTVDYYPGLLLYSVVIYVGSGTGRHDTGQHTITDHHGRPALAWSYQVIHLWDVPADDLLAMQQPALAPLVGLTRITRPDATISQAVAQIKTVPDRETQRRLFAELILLCNDEELTTMVQKLIEQEGLGLDTPFMRQLRVEGREEELRNVIIKTLATRFALADAEQQEFADTLATVSGVERLQALFDVALQAPDVAAFRAALAQRETDEPAS